MTIMCCNIIRLWGKNVNINELYWTLTNANKICTNVWTRGFNYFKTHKTAHPTSCYPRGVYIIKKLEKNENISYAGCPGLSWMVLAQFTLKMPSFEGNLLSQRHQFISVETRNAGLPYGENPVSLSDLGLIRYRVVTPGQTDGQTESP